MQVSTFMTKDPFTIEGDATAQEALRCMYEHGVRHLPVMEGCVLTGVISDRDVLASTGGDPRPPAEPDGALVRELMNHPPLTVHPDDSVVTIAVEVVLRGIGCLPVVQSGALVGIVTEMDLLRLLVRACRQGELSGDLDPPLREHMTENLLSLEASDSLDEALEACHSAHIRHLPVVVNKRLVGIVSDRDLRQAQGRHKAGDTPVESLMTREVQTLGPGDPLSEAAACMHEHKFSAMPVVEDAELVGIVTITDVLDHCMVTLRSTVRK